MEPKWSLNGAGIDWRGPRRRGFCARGTSRMFDRSERRDYRLNACSGPEAEGMRVLVAAMSPACHALPLLPPCPLAARLMLCRRDARVPSPLLCESGARRTVFSRKLLT